MSRSGKTWQERSRERKRGEFLRAHKARPHSSRLHRPSCFLLAPPAMSQHSLDEKHDVDAKVRRSSAICCVRALNTLPDAQSPSPEGEIVATTVAKNGAWKHLASPIAGSLDGSDVADPLLVAEFAAARETGHLSPWTRDSMIILAGGFVSYMCAVCAKTLSLAARVLICFRKIANGYGRCRSWHVQICRSRLH